MLYELTKMLGPSGLDFGQLYKQAQDKKQELLLTGSKPLLITGPTVRRFVKKFFRPVIPELHVLSISELLPDIVINTIGSIGLLSYD